MLVNQSHVPSVRLVERAVIDNEIAGGFLDQVVCLLPQRLGIGSLSLQQAGKSVMGRRSILRSVGLGRFDT